MDEQRQRSGRGRRRRRKARPSSRPVSEPILIAARRPNAPLLQNGKPRHAVNASAAPARTDVAEPKSEPRPSRPPEPPPRRTARIVQVADTNSDDLEKERRRLLQRVLNAEGRSAISRAAEEYRRAGFEFPVEQDVQLQLLEHADEDHARQAIVHLTTLLEREPPIKKPIFEQRLRRLEEYADEAATRSAAAALRRVIRA